MDVVVLRNLHFELAVGLDAWHRRGKPQPVLVSLEIGSGVAIQNAAAGDDVSKALDYGKLFKLIHGKLTVSNTQFRDVHALHDTVRNCIASNVCVKIEITLPKALLRAEGGLTYARIEEYKDDYLLPVETLSIMGIRCACIIGVNPHERIEKQVVVVDLIFTETSDGAPNGAAARKVPADKCQAVTTDVVERVEGSAYQTVEALATAIAQTVTINNEIGAVTVRVEKPSAIASIDAAGVQLRRTASFFQKNDFWAMNPSQ